MTDDAQRIEASAPPAEQFPEAERSLSADDAALFTAAAPDEQQKQGEYVSRAEMRLMALNEAIASYPDAAANYVLRGELLLKLGEAALAAADFRYALALTAAQVQTADWGLVAQTLHDRALVGLTRALRRLNQ